MYVRPSTPTISFWAIFRVSYSRQPIPPSLVPSLWHPHTSAMPGPSTWHYLVHIYPKVHRRHMAIATTATPKVIRLPVC